MTYSREMFSKAKSILESRREEAELKAENNRLKAISKCPEIASVERDIQRAGISVFKAIGMAPQQSEKYLSELAAQSAADQQKEAELLKSVGMTPEDLEPSYSCNLCNDKGVYDGHYCECFKKLLKRLSYDELSRDSKVRDSGFDNFRIDFYPDSEKDRMRSVIEYCKSWADDFNENSPSVLMFGSTGLGKTHLSLAMADVVINKGYGVIYGSAQNLFRKTEDEHFGRAKSDIDTESALLDCDLLILDDLGAEFSTQFTQALLYNIINTRINTSKPTIINTNLSPDEIEATYSQRIASRIIGEYAPLQFAGNDIRQIKNNID